MRRIHLAVVLVSAACGDPARAPDAGAADAGATDAGTDVAPPVSSDCNSWRQWGNSASHAGTSCVSGQPLQRALADMVYDPFLAQEVAAGGGLLFVHYQTPLIDGDDLYMMTKHGTYTPCTPTPEDPLCNGPGQLYRLHSQIWSEQRFAIAADGALVLRWSFDSDWKPEPGILFEPIFQPALAGALIAIPGAGGTLWELDRLSGQVVRHVQPFGSAIDPDTYVAGGIAVAPDGTIYYNALKLDHDHPAAMPSQAWLVAVAPDGTARTADYASLVRGAPGPDDLCFGTYDARITPLPWPPVDATGAPLAPPSAPCGPQRPGLNVTPAIGSDGTIFTVSRAQKTSAYSYVIAVDRTLSARWVTSLRDVLHDDCGVARPSDGTETEHMLDCRVGTPLGLERVTGLAPAGRVDDGSSSSPVALPDGGVLYSAFTGYNGSRGHLFKLDPSGAIVGTYDFGWDSTPAVFGGPTDYKIVVKDNYYGQDQGVDHGPFFITELDASLHIVWRFQSTSTASCARQPDGSIVCNDDHPHGFEWCINAPAVDRDGVVYANSEDGNAYAIAPDGTLRDKIFLDRALGAAYTPIALDHAGRVFALNGGHLSVIGR